MPALAHRARREGGASAESTERDQLAGERNVRDADSSAVATDHSAAAHPHRWPSAAHLRGCVCTFTPNCDCCVRVKTCLV